ncbi:unknown protein [Desulfotalea psychrophila LSv54]|uniref:Uncharacterized protein n=2 Tax=Desulfotalea psychrophila TaxID=84980 RepID=Q6AQD2_DESPS|nr:unknown protein [Desulfotalea psychrophila LSv54]
MHRPMYFVLQRWFSMGLLKGSASFVRFSVEGDLPENPLDFVADRVMSFAFRDIDDTYDEYSIGWVSINNMFDAKFKFASYIVGDYVTLTLRIDERRVSPAILKKCIQKEEERIKEEKQIPKIGRAMKVEIKERIRSELLRKSVPIPSIFDVCWGMSNSTLLFFSTNKKMQAVLEDFFKESFGLMIKQQIPYVVAESLISEENQANLELITPGVFV